MTDEQILRRLAAVCNAAYFLSWNPLTNWSDCGPLVEKYGFDVEYELIGGMVNWSISKFPMTKSTSYLARDPDLKRAICLAIIASEE